MISSGTSGVTIKTVREVLAKVGSNEVGMGNWEAWDKREKEREGLVADLNEAAREGGGIIGRAVSFGVADGSATYVVTGATEHLVTLEHVHLYDGYTAPYIGMGGQFERGRIEQQLSYDDKIDALFKERGKSARR